MRQSVKQNGTQNDTILNSFTHGGVLELADRQDLGSCAERREGSSPSFPTEEDDTENSWEVSTKTTY